MCTLDSIKLQVMVFSWFKIIIAVYVFGTGIYFTSSTDLQQAFGTEYVSYGLSLIFLALLSGAVVFPHKYATNRHNRFLLAVAFVFDTIVFAELINFGLIVGSYMPSEFPKELQLDCLRNTPLIYSAEECAPFYESDRTAGMRLLWETYYSDKANKVSFQVLTTFEAGTCCGFFQPFNCIANPDKFPSTRLQKGVDGYLLESRVICSEHEFYYPVQDNCVDYKDFAADPPIIGGCHYDLGVGFCLNVDIKKDSLGCASTVEDYAVGLIAPHSVMLLVSSAFSLLFMTYSCCMWWKRKDADLFPAFVTEVKVNRQYKFVKDQFEVVPKKDLLIVEGFVPPPKGYNLELTDLTKLESSESGKEAGKDGGGASAAATPPSKAKPHKPKPRPKSARKVHPDGDETEVDQDD